VSRNRHFSKNPEEKIVHSLDELLNLMREAGEEVLRNGEELRRKYGKGRDY
jgi:hypothetical protein